MALDIVSIVFEDDADLVSLQLASFSHLFAIDDLRRFIVILNGRDNLALRVQIANVTTKYMSSEFRDKLAFVDALAITRGSAGQLGQQLLKLAIARLIETPYYICLDSKNHLVKAAAAQNFFHATGIPITHFARPSEVMMPLLVASLNYFSVNSPEAINQAMPTITPYVLHTDTVLDLMREIETREGAPFAEAFLRTRGTVTEFWLYYAYLLWSGRCKALYASSSRICETLFTRWPEDPDVCSKLIGNLNRKEVIMFGLHRRRIPQLTESHIRMIQAFWKLAGLPHELCEAVLVKGSR